MGNPAHRAPECGNFSANGMLLPFDMCRIEDSYFSWIIVELVSVLESANSLCVYTLRRKKKSVTVGETISCLGSFAGRVIFAHQHGAEGVGGNPACWPGAAGDNGSRSACPVVAAETRC